MAARPARWMAAPPRQSPRGLCSKHGANRECLREGCATCVRKKGGVCSKHTVKLSCADPDCDTPQRPGKFVCFKHGAFGYCTTDACINTAITMRGKCKAHDSKTVACSDEGCSTNAAARGLCKKHGTYGTCPFNNCTSAVRARGRCTKHGGGSKQVCNGGRLHYSCSSTRCLLQAWCPWNMQVWRVRHQCSIWIFALLQTRRLLKAVPRGRLHHQLPTQGSLRQTRRWSRRMCVWRLHQPEGGKHVEGLLNAEKGKARDKAFPPFRTVRVYMCCF